MNTWPTNDQFNMMNMQNMMQTNSMQPGMVNMGMMNDWSQMNAMMSNANAVTHSGNFVGPVQPVQMDNKDMGDSGNNQNEGQSGSKRDDKNRRSREPDRNRDRNDHRSDQRSRSGRRERRSKWSDNDNNLNQQQNNSIMNNMGAGNMGQGNMMPYTNMMDMQSMNAMSNMTMNPMMPGMSMMPNMMDQNQMMLVQMQMMGQQVPSMPLSPIYISNGILLPPIPGTMTPSRRDRPPGCRTIFVGGIPKNITKDVITEIFQRFGPISDVQTRQGISHVRFEKPETVELSFFLSGYKYKLHDQSESDAMPIFIDYALNQDDRNEFEKNKSRRELTPPRVEIFSPQSLEAVTEKIKSDTDFAEAAPTLAAWLERGECNKKNANTFYSLVQASNSQVRRLYNEKITIDEEYQNLKQTMKDKFSAIVVQFEQVAKILSAAKLQRVSDHFSKQQRRNIEMWFKMTEDLENIKEEFNTMFEDNENETDNKNMVPLQKYEQLKKDNENLIFELEGYKNEAHLAQNEAERKFEKFKAQFIAQQALVNKDSTHKSQTFPPLPLPPLPPIVPESAPLPPSIPDLEAKIISVLTAYLLAQPLGASLENLVSYVRSIIPGASQPTVNQVLGKYPGLFNRAVGGGWMFVTFDIIKQENA